MSKAYIEKVVAESRQNLGVVTLTLRLQRGRAVQFRTYLESVKAAQDLADKIREDLK